LSQRADELSIFRGLSPAHFVIEMRYVKPESGKLRVSLADSQEHIEQRNRIRPARYGDRHARRYVKHRVMADETQNFFESFVHGFSRAIDST
jgi:hypothetical protein